MGKTPTLGKGLASLIPSMGTQSASSPPSPPAGAVAAGPQIPVPTMEGSASRHPGISIVPIDEIKVNPYQPRREFDEETLEELAQSIKANGVIQPLVVRKTQEGYQLIAGERRLRASKGAGLTHVPIVIRRSTDKEALEIALVENIQRENLNCIDEAMAYFQLSQEFSLTQEEVAERVGKERATVANYLRLLRLPEVCIQDLRNGVLSFGHGKALLAAKDHEVSSRARLAIIDQKLSVREAEALVGRLNQELTDGNANKQVPVSPQRSPLQERFATLSQEIGRKMSTKVEIKGTERHGKIVLHYKTREDLERLIVQLQTEHLWQQVRN